jgi:putative acetyltransferase
MAVTVEQVAHPTTEARAFQPAVAFFLARLDGVAVGCGGIAFEEGFAEVKRMFVRPTARGQGIAQAVLSRLEAEAKGRGYTRLMLETGDAQHAAIAIYERAGFRRCEPFGSYVSLPAASILRSVFYGKAIG